MFEMQGVLEIKKTPTEELEILLPLMGSEGLVIRTVSPDSLLPGS